MEHEDFEDRQKPEDFDGFISYAREDLPFVKELIARLASREHRLWIDLEGIYSGEAWWPRICAAIESSDAFIFVIPPESVASFNCGREVAHAASHRKRILLIRLRFIEASIEGQDAGVAQLSRRLAARVLREKDLDPEIGVQGFVLAKKLRLLHL